VKSKGYFSILMNFVIFIMIGVFSVSLLIIDALVVVKSTFFLFETYKIAKLVLAVLIIPIVIGLVVVEKFGLVDLYLPFKKRSLDNSSKLLIYLFVLPFIVYNIICVFIYFMIH
jgi:hypothetical protein